MKNYFKDFLFNKVKYGSLFKRRLKLISSYMDLSDSKILEIENHKLIDQIKNSYYKSPFYKELYDSHGVNINQIQNKEDLIRLPSITKAEIRGDVDKIFIGNGLKYTAHTSGTSGTPLKVYYSLDCVWNEASYNELFRNNAGHFFGDKIISLRGALDGTRKERYDKFNNILYLSSYHISPQNADWYYEKIKEFNPKTILGYPSSLESLSMIFAKKGLKIRIPLAFTSSESLYPHQQELIESQLGCKIYDRYGNAERTISLVQDQHKWHYVFPKLYSVNEFLNDGKILTTNLINPQFPLIRYQVEDQIEINSNNTVERIGGRVDDCLTTVDGRRIGSAAMSLAIKKVPNILMAQIEQKLVGKILIKIVPTNYFTNIDKNTLEREVRNRIGNEMKVEIKIVQETEIKKTKANKYKLIIKA